MVEEAEGGLEELGRVRDRRGAFKAIQSWHRNQMAEVSSTEARIGESHGEVEDSEGNAKLSGAEMLREQLGASDGRFIYF
jgi:hypothetical protein